MSKVKRLGVWVVLGAIMLVSAALYGQRSREVKRVAKLSDVPNPADVQKALVIPKSPWEDESWAYDMEPDWIPYVYTTSKSPQKGYKLVPPMARGREAMVYLTFIIEHYDTLPNITAFVHGGKEQRHNVDLGPWTPTILENLRLDTVVREGYVNLRCETAPNCPIGINPHHPTETDIKNKDTRAYFVEIYMELFGVTAQEVPEHIGSVCCAQFAVTKEQIRKRPKADYVRMRHWIMTTKQTNDFGTGWVFENLWHIVFGKDAIHCPTREQCKCDLFGWCGPHPESHRLDAQSPLDNTEW